LEIGFGGGEHLAARAEAAPLTGFIGCEPYVNGIVTLLTRIRDDCLDNIRIFPDDARTLLDALSPNSLLGAAILFPDPWPKARHHKRRLIQRPLLDALARALVSGAELRIATDDADYAAWIRVHLDAYDALRWVAALRVRPDDWPATRYETWSLGEGRVPHYFVLRRS
jgi:tRNA (guanine-N7-)-methyltransferase